MIIVDFIGRVNNTPLSTRQALVPLFEAIINSIHSIGEAGRESGRITVIIKRDIDSLLIKDDEQIQIASITGFDIVDNGIGFNGENFEAFNTSDTQKKSSIGGKGIGRFLWLKAFNKVNISSIFDQNGQLFKRTFDFILSNDPIANDLTIKVPKNSIFETTISLSDLKPEFSEHIPRQLSTIAYKIIEHFLEYFVLRTMPLITIQDGKEIIDLWSKYYEWISDDAKSEFEVSGHKFTLLHFLLKARSGMSHKINFCAVHRVVDGIKLDSKVIPNLPSRISSQDASEELIYMGYLSSPFLDKQVDQPRTGFNLSSEDHMKFLDEVSWDEIEDKALEQTEAFLQSITEPIKTEKQKLVEEYVHEEAPQFRSLLKYRPDAIDEISPDVQPEKLDLELYKAQKKWEVELRETADEIIKSPSDVLSEDGTDIQNKYLRFLEEWNENGKAALAKYVIHRKITLTLLEAYMQQNEDGGYARERTIHQLIFPLKNTSDDIDYEQQNLWVIDEKLAFHKYLSSDLEFRQMNVIESDERDRPDLLIFNNPIAVIDGEPINGITIFEFKKPMRDDSNPVNQMFGYVRKIRTGKAVTNHGRPITVRDETPFFCYAVCDLPQSLRANLENMGMLRVPDNEGYFMYNPNLRAYVEVISYEKLIKDAKQRNRILFEKLNITE